MARFLRTDTNSSGGHSRLRGPEPPIITPAAVFIAQPVQVSLAYSTRGKPLSGLGQPKVLLPNSSFPQGPMVQYAPSSRGKAKSFLRAPVVVTAEAAFVATPVRVTLTRIRPFPTDASVFKPVVVAQAQGPQGGVGIQLAPSFRGKAKSFLRPSAFVTAVATEVFFGPKVELAKIKPVRTISRLQPPTVVAPVLASPVHVTLARIKPAAIHSVLRKPTDLVDQQDLGFVRVHLAYSRRGAPKSVLRKPTVVAPVLARRIEVTLAPQKRGVPKSVLHAPTVVAPVLARQIDTTLVRIRPVATHPILRRPVDLVDSADLGFVRVQIVRITPPPVHSVLRKPVAIDLSPQTYYLDLHLAYSLRGIPKSLLRPASLFTPQAKAETTVAVTLAYSLRGKPKSFLRKPADLVDRDDLGSIRTSLSYSLRGKPKPRLSPPAVVAPVLARAIRVELTRIRPVRTSTRLGDPVIVTPRVPQDATLDITLVRIRPVRTIRFLRSPTAVFPFFARPTKVDLAPSFRGKAKSNLGPPVVIDLRPQTRFLGVHLTYSLRGKPKSVLPQASLFAPVPKAERVLAVTLAYSRRGKPKSKLSLPVVVTAATPYLRPIDVTLAPQSRGKAKSRFAPPTVFAPVPPVQGEIRGGRRLRLESIYDEDDWLAAILGEV